MKFSVCRGVMANNAFLLLEKWLHLPLALPSQCMAQQANLLQSAGEPFNSDFALQMHMLLLDRCKDVRLCSFSFKDDPEAWVRRRLWDKKETLLNGSPKQKAVIQYRSSPSVPSLCYYCTESRPRLQTLMRVPCQNQTSSGENQKAVYLFLGNSF